MGKLEDGVGPGLNATAHVGQWTKQNHWTDTKGMGRKWLRPDHPDFMLPPTDSASASALGSQDSAEDLDEDDPAESEVDRERQLASDAANEPSGSSTQPSESRPDTVAAGFTPGGSGSASTTDDDAILREKIKRLASELAEMERKLAIDEKKCHEEKEVLRKALEEERERRKKAEQELQIARKAKESLHADIEEIRRKCAEHLDKLTKRYEEKEDDFKVQKDALEERIANADWTIQNHEDLSEQHKDAKRKLEEVTRNLAASEQASENVRKENLRMQQQIDKLNKVSESQKREINDLHDRTSANSADLVKDLQGQLKEVTQKYDTAQNNSDSDRLRADNLEDDVKALKAEIKTLKKREKDSEAYNQEFVNHLAEKDTEIDKLQKKLDTAEASNKKLAEDNQSLSQRVDETNATVEAHTQLTEQHKKLKREYDQIKISASEHEGLKTAYDELARVYQTLEEESNLRADRIDELEAERQGLLASAFEQERSASPPRQDGVRADQDLGSALDEDATGYPDDDQTGPCPHCDCPRGSIIHETVEAQREAERRINDRLKSTQDVNEDIIKLRSEVSQLRGERDQARTDRDLATQDQNLLRAERDQAITNRDQAITDGIARVRDELLADLDKAKEERDALDDELEDVKDERDELERELTKTAEQLARIRQERDQLQRDLTNVTTATQERDTARAERDAARIERDTAMNERDAAISQRDQARAELASKGDEADVAQTSLQIHSHHPLVCFFMVWVDAFNLLMSWVNRVFRRTTAPSRRRSSILSTVFMLAVHLAFFYFLYEAYKVYAERQRWFDANRDISAEVVAERHRRIHSHSIWEHLLPGWELPPALAQLRYLIEVRMNVDRSMPG